MGAVATGRWTVSSLRHFWQHPLQACTEVVAGLTSCVSLCGAIEAYSHISKLKNCPTVESYQQQFL